MKLEIFELERIQSLWENRVKYNLTESGLYPYTLKELLDEKEIERLLSTRLGYNQTNGSPELRKAISNLYSDAAKLHADMGTCPIFRYYCETILSQRRTELGF